MRREEECGACGWTGDDPRVVPVARGVVIDAGFRTLDDEEHVCPQCGKVLDDAPPPWPMRTGSHDRY